MTMVKLSSKMDRPSDASDIADSKRDSGSKNTLGITTYGNSHAIVEF